MFARIARLFNSGQGGASATRTPITSFSLEPTKSVATNPMVRWREGSFPMAVVGESSFQDALIAVCGRHTRHGHEGVYEAVLRPEPTNTHDPNAIMVQVKGRLVGYLAREQAIRVGEQMRVAGLSEARCLARIRGGWRTNQYDEGQYGVQLAIPGHGWIDFGIGASPPTAVKRETKPKSPKAPPSSTKSGPLTGRKIALMGATSDGDLALELAGTGAQIMQGVGKTTDF